MKVEEIMPVLCSVNISSISALPIWNSWKSKKDGKPNWRWSLDDVLLLLLSFHPFLLWFDPEDLHRTCNEDAMLYVRQWTDNRPHVDRSSPCHVHLMFFFFIWLPFVALVSSVVTKTYGAVMDFPFGFPTLFLLLLTTAHNPWSSSFL